MIGKAIKYLLDQNETLLGLVPTERIFPYILNEDTPLPSIVYTIDGASPEYCKDGWVSDDVTFSVITLSDNYSTLQDIVVQVRVALDFLFATVDDVTIGKIRLSGFEERYLGENIFMNKLTFNTTLKSY
jgi:hypothetical protein